MARNIQTGNFSMCHNFVLPDGVRALCAQKACPQAVLDGFRLVLPGRDDGAWDTLLMEMATTGEFLTKGGVKVCSNTRFLFL
jgi:hypothetical protein